MVMKLPAIHATRMFITALTSLCQLSLSWANPIQSTYPHPTSWRSILILSSHLRLGLPSGLLPSGFPTKTLYVPLFSPYVPHALPISFFSILSPAQYCVRSTLSSARHLSLSWAHTIQSKYPHTTSCRSILILSTYVRLGLPSGLFPSGFITKTLYTPSTHPYKPLAQPIIFVSILSPAHYWVRSTKYLAPRYATSVIPSLPRPS